MRCGTLIKVGAEVAGFVKTEEGSLTTVKPDAGLCAGKRAVEGHKAGESVFRSSFQNPLRGGTRHFRQASGVRRARSSSHRNAKFTDGYPRLSACFSP